MIFKEINLQANNHDAAATEIMFEIAGARADGVELIRINISETSEKMLSGVVKMLRGMKQKGLIQFFATEQSFDSGSTEAVFLINKYSSVIEGRNGRKEQYIYVKL